MGNTVSAERAEMVERLSSVTTKGQVTIPIEIRRLLGVQPHDKVAFRVKGGQVSITRPTSVIEQTAGIFKSDAPPLSAEALRSVGEEAMAQEAVERAQR
jgi:antitoxin PrlF